MGLPLRKNHEIFTYADYLSWPEEERWELIEGVPFDMSPAPSPYHQEISMNLSYEILRCIKENKGKCKVYAAPFDVRLPEKDQPDEETSNVVQPDISVICDLSKIDDKGCKGSPELIIEIISPATAKKDIKYKLQLYEKHGVPEYWIVHPEERILQVYRLDEKMKYGRADVYFQDDTIPLKLEKADLEINLEPVFAGR